MRARELLRADLSPEAEAIIEAIVEESLVLPTEAPRQMDLVKETPSGRMKRPTLEQVIDRGKVIGLPEGECRRFFDFYESKGWRVGNQPMRLWTAAQANWKRSWEERATTGLSADVATVRNQVALKRVEDRLDYLRGQFPLTSDRMKQEWNTLKQERASLMAALRFKA